MRPLLLCLLAVLALAPIRPAEAAEPFFKKGDVIALVGGEDMVVASEYGYLELLLTRALPDYHLRFRNLAWEGDTVFEQRRDLNFPPLEAQLEQVGATVVLCQFGQMESLAGKEKLPEFVAAYENLLKKIMDGGKRMVVVVGLTGLHFSGPPREPIEGSIEFAYEQQGIYAVANKLRLKTFGRGLPDDPRGPLFRDTFHLTAVGHYGWAFRVAGSLGGTLGELNASWWAPSRDGESFRDPETERLRQLIIAKNRLWFDYWRPQNWAFLAGDRTAQPSSRDHLDPSKRWFPPEREAFLPLLEAKEKQIDALAAQLAAGNAGK